MRDLAVLTFIGVGLLASLVNAFTSVLFYWWVAIFRPQDYVWGDIDFLRISLVAGVIVVVGCLVRGILPKVRGTTGVALIAIVILTAVATYTNGCSFSLTWLDHVARLTLILLITDRFLSSPERVTQLLAVIAISLLFYAGKAGLAAILAGGASQLGISNLSGTFTGSNAFALGTAVAIFFALATIPYSSALLGRFATPKLSRWYALGVYVVCGLGAFNVLSLGSRGATLAMFVGILLFVMSRPGGGAFLLKLTPFALIAVLIVPLPEGFEERITSAFSEEEERDKSAASRPHFWGIAVRMADAHPMGVGPQCYNSYYDSFDDSGGFFGRNRSVHSAHFQMLAEWGYLGALIWIFLIVTSVGQCLAIKRRSRSTLISKGEGEKMAFVATCMGCALVVYVLGGMFYAVALMELVWVVFIAVNALNQWSKQAITSDMSVGK